MRRYVLSAVLFVFAVVILTGCSSLFDHEGSDAFYFYLYLTETSIIPASNYQSYNTIVRFYHAYYYPDVDPYVYIDNVSCNGIELGKDVGIFRGQVAPVDGEEFFYTAGKDGDEASWGTRLQKPVLRWINEGDNIPVSSDYIVIYFTEDGDSVQVWCEDDNGISVTAGEQDDDGTYGNLDTTELNGPGRIRISRFYRDRPIHKYGLDSAVITEGEMVSIVNVIWVN